VGRVTTNRAAAELPLAQGVSPGSSGTKLWAAERRHPSRPSLFQANDPLRPFSCLALHRDSWAASPKNKRQSW